MPLDVVPRDLAYFEIVQQAQLGHDVSAFRERYECLDRDRAPDAAFTALAREVEQLPAPMNSPWVEPNDLGDIVDTLPPPRDFMMRANDRVCQQVLRGWQGRIVGNMLGKPIERAEVWNRTTIKAYLQSKEAYPLNDYIPVDAHAADALGFQDCWPDSTLGRINGTSRDDDIDYTILGLHLLEMYGPGYTTGNVANEWLHRLPYRQVFTAERAAYRNLVNGVVPELAARTSNPYREWVGALIRGDIFGYVRPGAPRQAALLSYADARLSHTGNGIYGEMWAAALVSAAFTTSDPREAVESSLLHVPPHSRLAEEIRQVLNDHAQGRTWEDALGGVEARHVDVNSVHTVNNAGVICAGLLWGSGDFTTTIALTVQGGLDTDSNGATAGSVAGIQSGSSGIADHWLNPLHDTVHSAVQGFDCTRITELAARTAALIQHTEKS